MPAPFNVNDLSIASALQLTLWPAQPEMRTLTAKALAAFGTADQAADLELLGVDFVSYLQFESAELETANYPQLAGFRITHSVLSMPGDSGRLPQRRSVRILTSERNGPILRGFGDIDHPREITAVFSHLSTDQWQRLVLALGWDPQNLSTANSPGIAFYPTADPEMTLLSPPYWT